MEADAALASPGPGPAGDYPVVIGEPFTIGETTYTPIDTLNFDAVGLAVVAQEGEGRISGAHKTLPLPSYVEVTHLDTGRTALVRLETRGPMRNDAVIALSHGAAAQLGIADDAMPPVRVRRVNPPEPERALLRQGEQAPLRMDTPAGLLTVLKRKLAPEKPLVSTPPVPAIVRIDPDEATKAPAVEESPALTPPEQPEDAMAVTSPPEPAKGANLYVQIGAFSTQERADRAAAPLEGTVTKPGKLWIVRTGPYTSAADADTGLEKARASGYSDAMVKRIG